MGLTSPSALVAMLAKRADTLWTQQLLNGCIGQHHMHFMSPFFDDNEKGLLDSPCTCVRLDLLPEQAKPEETLVEACRCAIVQLAFWNWV